MEEARAGCELYNSKRYSSRIYNNERYNTRYTRLCNNLLIRKPGRLQYLLESEYEMSFSCEYDRAS